jgi:hypothetical protein
MAAAAPTQMSNEDERWNAGDACMETFSVAGEAGPIRSHRTEGTGMCIGGSGGRL